MGAELVPGAAEPAGVMSLAACQGLCSSTPGCTAIVMPTGTSPGQCFLRKDIVEQNCAAGSPYTTWLKGESPLPSPSPLPPPTPAPSPPSPSPSTSPTPPAGGWTEEPGLNCYPGMGAELVPGAAEPAGVMSLAACQGLCSSTPGCTAIVMPTGTSPGQCFLRKDIVEQNCAAGSPYTTWLKGEAHAKIGKRSAMPGKNCYPAGAMGAPGATELDRARFAALVDTPCEP